MKEFIDVGDSKNNKENEKPENANNKNEIPKGRETGLINEGYIISGRYRVEKLLGRGGMADVYLAADLADGKKVAVKILKAELTNDKDFIRRFDEEAQAVSSLSHQSIVNVFDVGCEGEFRYIIFEYIDGISLKELIDKNEKLTPDVAVPIAIQIGLALKNAHKNGIIHRDIKPHNILITKDFVAKVTDFGIARTNKSSNTVTLTGKNTMGSVHYFSPEQARGGIVGEKSDIYSLGVVLYEMLTGKLPYNGDTPVSVALKHIQENPVPPSEIDSEIPEGLSNIVMKCMQKSSDYRYTNAGELVDELDAFMIDPAGSYGHIEKYDENSKTSVVSAVERDSNFKKLKEIEYTDRQVKKNKWKERILVIFAVIIITGILAGSAYYGVEWIKQQLTPPVIYYVVDNFIGKNIDDVRNTLNRENIDYEIFYEENATVPEGIVFFQSVQQGLELRPGGASTITLRVSSGKNTVKIEDYTGRNYRLAESELTQILGLTVVIEKELSGEHPRDNIIRTIPEAGNDVPKGGEITLIVSEGLMDVEVPEVLGLVRSEVLELLEENFLVVGSEALIGDPDLPDEEQYLLGIEPRPGTVVRALTRVIITFGSYEDYENSILPDISPTQPDETAQTDAETEDETQ